MDKPTQLKFMVIASGKTPVAIMRKFYRNKWVLSDEVVKKYIEMSQLKKRLSLLEKEIEELSRDTVSQQTDK